MEWRYRRTQGSSGGDYIVGEGSGEEGSKTKKKNLCMKIMLGRPLLCMLILTSENK